MTCDNGDEDSDADERELARILCARTVLSVPVSTHEVLRTLFGT